MRTAFIEELTLQARAKSNLFLVVGDLGFSVVEPFAQEFPDRFLNAGVAEQNMTGVAAGLAAEGFHVFTYSIANFPTLRCLEQIRNDVCYHRLPVTIVSVGAGFSYGNLGYSHHAIQDLAAMRSLAELTILSPADPGEARECVQLLAANPCPSYLRLGKAGEPELHSRRGIQRGPLEITSGGTDVALVATGSCLKVAIETAQLLGNEGLPVNVYSCPWLQPVKTSFLSALTRFSVLFVLEEHHPTGGLASLLRDSLPQRVAVRSVGRIADVLGLVGTQNALRLAAGLDSRLLAQVITSCLAPTCVR